MKKKLFTYPHKVVVGGMDFEVNDGHLSEGLRILKTKYMDECPFPQLEEFWNEIKPMSFEDIASMSNLENRRIALNVFGIERLVKEVRPTLINQKTIKKKTTWINENGKLEKKTFNDTYELYKVNLRMRSTSRWVSSRNGGSETHYYVKFKDTSTDREYMIWVDLRGVHITNTKNPNNGFLSEQEIEPAVNAIQAIAWTIQTDVPVGGIEEIIRQGDCILIRPKKKYKPVPTRNLTEKEYRTLLTAES